MVKSFFPSHFYPYSFKANPLGANLSRRNGREVKMQRVGMGCITKDGYELGEGKSKKIKGEKKGKG